VPRDDARGGAEERGGVRRASQNGVGVVFTTGMIPAPADLRDHPDRMISACILARFLTRQG